MPASSDLCIVTPRTIIVRTPTDVIERRLRYDDFFADVDLGPEATEEGYRVASVHFPPTWPGDAVGDFEAWLKRRREDAPEGWSGTIVARKGREAIGQVGCTDVPDENGTVEIRYATNAPQRDRGIATEAGGAFVAWLLERPDVNAVIAECRVDNAASVRVIEKLGFRFVDEREDDDGRLLRWEKRPV